MEAGDSSRESHETDEALLANVAIGDHAAFEQLFRRYQRRLFRYLFGMVRAEAVAEELMCEAMTDVWRNAGTFQGRSRVSTWIFAIASNKAATVRRRPQLIEADPEVVLRLEDSNPGPAEEIAQKELVGQIRAALSGVKATIVDGPSAAGYYLIDVSLDGDLKTPLDAMQALRGRPDVVRFAELSSQ